MIKIMYTKKEQYKQQQQQKKKKLQIIKLPLLNMYNISHIHNTLKCNNFSFFFYQNKMPNVNCKMQKKICERT